MSFLIPFKMLVYFHLYNHYFRTANFIYSAEVYVRHKVLRMIGGVTRAEKPFN